MSVKIILSKTGEPTEKRQLIFDEEVISVGREPSNALALPGTQVSKLHARIERQGSDYFIVDLNSTNCTYVNGEQLAPGKQHALHHGDRISISDFDLEFLPVPAAPPPPAGPELHMSGEARVATTTTPASEKPVARSESPSSEFLERWSQLTTEIQNSLEKFGILELARGHAELQARCVELTEENRRLRAERQELPDNGRGSPEISPKPAPLDESRLEQIARALLQLFFKLSSGRSSFLSEFIVRTVVRTTSDLSLQPRSDEEFLRSFTDPRLSDKEFAARLALMQEEGDQIVLHMMGLLEGYRRSVDEGTRRILQRVDPDRLEEDLPDTILFRYLPPLADLKLFHVMRNRLRDLLQEDRGVLEKQVFRPGFARAYEECVESSSSNA